VNFADKVVIITGAGTGIGRALARQLLAEKAHVVLAGRRLDKLQEVIDSTGCATRATAVVTDVSKLNDLRTLIDTALTAHAHIDVVVHNAGIVYAGEVDSVSPAEVEHLMKVNVLAPIWLTQLVVPLLRQRPEAMIAYISSIGGLVQVPYQSFYCASKHALHGFSQSVRRELMDTRIKVVTAYPGNVESEVMSPAVQHHMEKVGFGLRHMMTAERAAGAIIAGMRRESPMIYVTGRAERNLARLNHFLPS
jgi:short-subunit dehydrogenase